MTPRPEAIEALLVQAQGNPAALYRVATLMRRSGMETRAVALCGEAMAGADARLRGEIRRFLGEGVPEWHFGIVRDHVRNAAYDAAIRRAVKPGMRVLEIGTGTGILAMMAARAGAAEVITCEMNPAIAEAARENIARNGYADRIRVISKHSDALDLATDLGGNRADLLVSEIISNDMIGQMVLPAHERAARDLLVPGAPAIPARGTMRVALMEDMQDGGTKLGEIDGFDLSAFNRLAPQVRPIHPGATRIALRSDSADLFHFDFSGTALKPDAASVECRSTGGRVTGVIQWIALAMDGETDYENAPAPRATACWSPLYYSFAQAIETAPGQIIRVHGDHDCRNLTIWSD
ncbi:50S ribosomal protein L11 methyltransferase [Sphingomonas sp. AOB5]|uniref:50S ribosomal protein L11 methyltransferase n=1 Tax=Sphingomonas sp. AOB5 TaxID=3034017 RepID=UPI0023F690A6|nr:50S ribosomal protein L11 methyltransferase [Sphingomonas sp. AOB5]MDF7774488.1 50S ribosomal protein L11 methyltransferase [Sphingomonas sp. AOB5]